MWYTHSLGSSSDVRLGLRVIDSQPRNTQSTVLAHLFVEHHIGSSMTPVIHGVAHYEYPTILMELVTRFNDGYFTTLHIGDIYVDKLTQI